MKILLCNALFLVASLPLTAAAGFPTEAEVAERLHPGMSAQEVIAQFGEPGGEVREQRDFFLFRYRAPIGQLNNEKEGYVGFEIQIVDGRVKDWHALRGSPSFERWPKPAFPRWTSTLWLLILGASVLYGAVRAFDRGLNEKLAIQNAYEAREIPRQKLPADFHFITHASTIQEVIDKLGPPTQCREHEVSERSAARLGAIEGSSGNRVIASYDFELPYNDAVILLPEPPYNPENQIAAVYYRPARMDDGA